VIAVLSQSPWLFAACTHSPKFPRISALNVSPLVVDVLCAYQIKALPLLRSINVESPLVARVHAGLQATELTQEELVFWSKHLAQVQIVSDADEETPNPKHIQVLQHQAAVS
jgi:hypothetical protein